MSSSSIPAPTPVRGWLSEEEQRAWVAVAHLMVQLPGALDAQLQRDSGVNLFEYFVLSRLSMAPDRTLRMSELSELTGGSLSRLSNVVKRLEQRGYVRRRSDPLDRRFTNAILTESGWDTVVASAPGHVDTVRQLVLDPLNETQVAALAEIGERLRSHARAEWEAVVDRPDDESGCGPECS
jgi:DNA-binding MarR family transcriptional regulator